jgi:hypothetical protein
MIYYDNGSFLCSKYGIYFSYSSDKIDRYIFCNKSTKFYIKQHYEGDVEDLCLDFTLTEELGGKELCMTSDRVVQISPLQMKINCTRFMRWQISSLTVRFVIWLIIVITD